MALKVHHLRPAPGAKTAKTRVGRGEGGKGGGGRPDLAQAGGADAARAPQAIAAAHGADVYRQSAMSGVVPTRTSAQDRVAVRAGAVAAAHAPYQNMQTSSFVNSRVPAGRGNGFSVF